MKKQAFTLIELLVVIAIISVLAALLMPALRGALIEARRVACASNLKQIYLGHMGYVDDNAGWLVSIDRPDGLLLNFAGVGGTWITLKHKYMEPYLDAVSNPVYRCLGAEPVANISGRNSWYTGFQVASKSLMRLTKYRVTNDTCSAYAIKPLTVDYIQGGTNTGDVNQESIWHDNRSVPVLMTDGHVIIYRPGATVTIPWNGTEYSTMGSQSMREMCEQ